MAAEGCRVVVRCLQGQQHPSVQETGLMLLCVLTTQDHMLEQLVQADGVQLVVELWKVHSALYASPVFRVTVAG